MVRWNICEQTSQNPHTLLATIRNRQHDLQELMSTEKTKRLRKAKHWLRRYAYYLPQVSLARYFCTIYLDAHFGDTDANMDLNGEAEFLKNTIPPNDSDYIVFDVGANAGEWANRVLEINPNIKIHCFEPTDTIFQQLQENVPPNVICNKLALGSQSGIQDFYHYESGGVHNSFFLHSDLLLASKERVTVETLDDYCRDSGISQINYLKIDVEGAELEVMRGAEELLSHQKIQIIQFEYGSKWIDARFFLKDAYEFARQLDYKVWKLIPGGRLRSIPRYDYRIERFRHSTYILTDPDIKN